MNSIFPIELDREQRRHLEDARELWAVWAPLARRRDELAGALGWKTVKGRQYLTHYWHDGDTGEKRMMSLGPRSEEAEKRKEEWERERREVDLAIARLKPRLDALGRVGRALRVGRLETAGAEVLRQVWRAGMLGNDLVIVGSAAVHLYEASAGVLVPQAVMPEGDLDLAAAERRPDHDELLRVLRRADKSFRGRASDYSFANRDGFRVDVLSLSDMRTFFTALPDISSGQERVLAEAFALPTVEAIGVARDGFPVPMYGLDPRTFALLKYVRAEFDLDRHRNAAEIDRDQAFAVGALVARYWRHEFDPEWFDAFPGLAEGLEASGPDSGGARFFM